MLLKASLFFSPPRDFTNFICHLPLARRTRDFVPAVSKALGKSAHFRILLKNESRASHQICKHKSFEHFLYNLAKFFWFNNKKISGQNPRFFFHSRNTKLQKFWSLFFYISDELNICLNRLVNAQ